MLFKKPVYMREGLLFIALALFCPISSVAEQTFSAPIATSTINIAVADFSSLNVSQADAAIISGFVRTELVRLGSFDIMDRNNMDLVLTEQKFQSSGCTEQQCAVEMGKLLNVHQIVVGSLSKLLEKYYVTVSLIDVETGKIIASYDAEASSGGELKKVSGVLARKIQAGSAGTLNITEKHQQPVVTDPPKLPTRPLEMKSSSDASGWALGVIYPGIALKYGANKASEWEAKAQSGSDILILGLRNYNYFVHSNPMRLFWGIEGDYISFKGKQSKGAGFACEAFVGGQLHLADQVSLLMDFGPMYINLSDSNNSESASGVEYVLNMGIYWHFK